MIDNSWNLEKLKRQAVGNQEFDDYVLNESGILQYDNLNVLDIGCSNGFKTEMLFDKYNNIKHITGIDVDENAINEAQIYFQNNDRYTFEVKNIYDLEAENKYDIINLSYVLQHLQDPKKILNILKNSLSDRGIIIIKVPDDSFKLCYPDNENLLHKIFHLYENEIMIKQNITKFTDRHIGKKVYSYLSENNYKNIKLYYSNTDTIGKTVEQKLKLFDTSIAFRSASNRNDISIEIKNEMDLLLNMLRKEFEKDNFYYTMSVLYYIASK